MTVRDLARTPARLARFVDERLRPAVIVRTAPVTIEHWVVPGEPVPFAHAVRQVFTPFAVGRSWGRPWGTVWLRVRGTVPEEWVRDARHGVELVADLGFDRLSPGFQAEGLAFRPDGSIVKAISPRNAHVPVEGDLLELYLELAANPGIHPESHWVPTRLGDPATAGDDELYRLDRLEIALVDREAWALVQDIEVLRGLAGELPADRPRRSQLWHALDRMLDAVDPDDLAGSIPSARAALAPVLAAPAAASAHTIIATGHAHIDSAWLWPVRETVRKCARTFSNVLALLDEHPQLRFACSSAQQLAWMKEHYPELFERIRAQVAAGRFVPVGGQWVEPDTNMPSGESTVRQFLLGKRFFLEEFGVDTTEVWLPDTFGYSAALPQLIRLAGADWFMTQKISWNETNRMPHHTFWWEGIDGTRVFTHFPPIETYNAELSPRELAHAERTFRDHATASVSLAPFGWGDGGGGPTREMVAAGRRQADLDGSPRVEFGSPRDFYERAAAESGELPVWSGEMYLELHRGTLTSQLRTKQGNRRSEEALRHAELWATTAAIRTGAPYPYDELTRCWERVLLLQFHDILPGSSIAWVHREAEEDHARIIRELDDLTAAALGMLAGEGDRELVANAAPIAVEHAPPLAVSAAPAAAAPATLQASERGWVLATDHVRAEVDRDGHLISLRDPSGREALAPGASAMLSLHRDRPGQWDAWDVDRSDHAHGVDLRDADEVVADVVDGVAAVHATRSVGASRIRQTISLAPGAHAVDIALDIDWRERHRLLRFVVPVDVLADRSTSEIQFGHLHRPTHANTSWDAARFEFVAHRWIHVGEAGYGVAVANDSTYGHSVERTTRPDGGTTTSIGLSVLRAPGFPDPGADRGRHRMRFAIRPGATLEDAAHEGFRLGGALRTIRGGRNVPPIVTSTDPAVRVEAVKLAEDRSGDLIVRVVESLGGRATTTVAVDAPVAHAEVVDLIERRIEGGVEMQGDPASLTLELRPFQVVTLRYRMRGGA